MSSSALQRLGTGLLAGSLLFGWALVACGPLEEEFFNPLPGKTCFDDSDCVPNDCCGQGSSVVHIDDAPSCASVTCNNACPKNQIDCGCGVPVCKDSRCAVAGSTDPNCN